MFGIGKKKQYEEVQKQIQENISKMQAIYQGMIDLVIPNVENYENASLDIIDKTIDDALNNALDRTCVNKCIALKPQVEKALEYFAFFKDTVSKILDDEDFEKFDEDFKDSVKSLSDRIENLEKTYQEKLNLVVKAASTTNTLCSRNEKFEDIKRIIQEQQEIRDKAKALNDKANSIGIELDDPNIDEERKNILMNALIDISLNFNAIVADDEKLNYYLRFK